MRRTALSKSLLCALSKLIETFHVTKISEVNNRNGLSSYNSAPVQIHNQNQNLPDNNQGIVTENSNKNEIQIISSSIAITEWNVQQTSMTPMQINSCMVDYNKNEIERFYGKPWVKNGDNNFINCNDVIVTESQTNNITYKEHYLCPDSWSELFRRCSSRRYTIIAGALALTLVLIVVLCVWLTNKTPSYKTYAGYPTNSNNSLNDTFIDNPKIPEVYTVRRIEWLAQPSREPYEKLWVDPASYVIIGQTETGFCFTQSQCVLYVRNLQFFHIESNGWNDIGYNFLVGGDGQIYEGHGWGVMGAHTKGYNSKSIGIGFIGTFNSIAPNVEQIYAARKLIEYAEESNRVSKEYKLVGYRQCRNAEGSGEKLYAVIRTWKHWSPTC